MLHDLRIALASFLRQPTVSVLVLLILALSLGVHTAVFSLIHAAFLKPLPFADAERLVVVETVSAKTAAAYGVSIPDADDYRAQARLLDEVGTYNSRRDNLITAEGTAHSVPSALVTAGVLPALGVEPAMGRLFEPQDDQPGGDSFKAVISHGLWHSHFAADSAILGAELRTSLGSYTVIGVMPPGFDFPQGTDLWLTAQNWIDTQDSGDARADQRPLRWFDGIARLAPGTSLAQAQEELEGVAAALAQSYPQTNEDWQPRLTPYREYAAAGLRPYLRSLFAMTWVFMILALVNLAGLQLARGIARSKTVSLQLALGASRMRLGRQLLLETILLTLPGTAVGLLLAYGLVRALPNLAPTALPSWLTLHIGPAEIAFALVMALGVALAGGVAPLVLGRRADLRSLLGGRSGTSREGHRLRSGLVVAEVALATLLLVAAGLLARSFQALEHVDPGFEEEGVVAVQLSPQHQGSYLEQTDSLAALFRRIQTRLLETPGIEEAGGTTHLPYLDRSRRSVTLVARGGADQQEEEHQAPILTVDVTPGYFAAMGIPVLEGRDFRWSDERDQGLVLILSRRAADRLFPGQSAVGKEARIASDAWGRVIGVVGDVRYDPWETGTGAELYYPITQYKAWQQRLAVRLAGPSEALIPTVRRALAQVAPEAGVVELKPLSTILGATLWQSRLLALLAPLFAVIALLLAALGVYGLLAHDLVQRRQELGVRAALGASSPSLARLMMARGIRLVLVGVGAGVVVALFLGPVLAASLFGIAARDPLSYALAGVALLVAGAAACLGPALRAMRVDPVEVLGEA